MGAFVLGYRPWLDGLRAIAIITVVGFHLSHLQHVIGGSGAAGLDVFFVLSGFLITILLLEERARTDAISLKAFYLRRVRRLFPALALLLIGIVLLALAGLPELPPRDVLPQVLAVAAYIGNWVKALSSETLGLLGHTWSLSVEEQFYLVWPLVLIGLSRRNVVGARLLAVIVAGAVASATWYEVLLHTTTKQGRVVFGTDTRAYALLLGCAAAVVLHHGLQPTTRSWARGRAGLAAAAAAYLTVLFLKPSLLPDTRSLILELTAVSTAVLIVHLGSAPPAWPHAVLSIPPLVWIGRLSYGLYLFHFPVIELLTPQRTDLHGGALALLDIAVSVALALASWTLLERRFLKRPFRPLEPSPLP